MTLLFSECGRCSRVLRIESTEQSLKSMVGTYECFGSYNERSSYKMTERNFYIYHDIYWREFRGTGYDVKRAWMVS